MDSTKKPSLSDGTFATDAIVHNLKITTGGVLGTLAISLALTSLITLTPVWLITPSATAEIVSTYSKANLRVETSSNGGRNAKIDVNVPGGKETVFAKKYIADVQADDDAYSRVKHFLWIFTIISTINSLVAILLSYVWLRIASFIGFEMKRDKYIGGAEPVITSRADYIRRLQLFESGLKRDRTIFMKRLVRFTHTEE